MKKLFLFILVVALCCALCACGKGGNKSSKEIEYDTAIAELRGLIAVSVPESKLKDPSYVYNREIEGEKWGPIFVFSPDLGELYKKFSEFGDYKQSKEILERFTVLENSYVVVDEVKVDLLGNEQKNEGVSRHTFDAQKRYICSNMRNTKIYDDDGNLVREDANTIHFYNDQGQRVETREYLDGLVDSIIEYVYDEKGNCVQEITKRIEGTHTKTYSYDENGRRISETTEGGTVTYVYDEYGNRIERDEKYSRIYDENNNFLIEWQFFTNCLTDHV